VILRQEVSLFKCIDNNVRAQPCLMCGVNCWVVDGDRNGNYWLLCMDIRRRGCLNTQPLPEGYTVKGYGVEEFR